MAHDTEPEVLIVGAGPVGLLAALFLLDRGIRIEIIDKSERTHQHSYALALHQKTLRILDEVGLGERLAAAGRRVDRLAFYEGRERRAEIDFTKLPGGEGLVVLRQNILERAAEDEIARCGTRISWNHQLQALRPEGERPGATVAELDQVVSGYPVARTEWVVMKSREISPAFVIGADGYESAVRRMSGIGSSPLGKGQVFSVFECEAIGELPPEVRVVLDEDRTSVYWPLEQGRCRWGFEIRESGEHSGTLDRFQALLAERAPWFTARPTLLYWTTLAMFEARLADAFGTGGAWLAGDSAHLANPVGVHSMNVGIQEARDLAVRIMEILRKGSSRDLLGQYDRAGRERWQFLLGGKPGLKTLPGADPWVARNRARILTCVPASGEDLAPLLGQVGLAPGD